MADHLSDAADVMPAITGVSGCSALDDIELVTILWVCGSHTVEAYSKCGLINDWYCFNGLRVNSEVSS